MFKRNKIPQRKEFSLTSEQFIEDINNVAIDEEQRCKLYQCIDDKLPKKNSKFNELDRFLEGHNSLEELSDNLKTLCDEIKLLEKELLVEGANITRTAKNALEKLCFN